MKVLKFPLGNFIESVYKAIKQRQDDLMKKRIEFLFEQAYQYYLDKYIVENIDNVDFHPALYQSRKIECPVAKTQAQEVILDVIKSGRVNECYSRRVKELKAQGVIVK